VCGAITRLGLNDEGHCQCAPLLGTIGRDGCRRNRQREPARATEARARAGPIRQRSAEGGTREAIRASSLASDNQLVEQVDFMERIKPRLDEVIAACSGGARRAGPEEHKQHHCRAPWPSHSPEPSCSHHALTTLKLNAHSRVSRHRNLRLRSVGSIVAAHANHGCPENVHCRPGVLQEDHPKKYADPSCSTISRQCTVHLREEGGGATYDKLSPRLRDLLLGERTV
jgi:hypothetical protein